jgi:DUF177 domain-containing protein
MTSFDLRRLRLRSGEEHREQVELDLQPLEFGGQRYLPVPATVPADLTVNRATTGTAFRLRFHVRLHGPCYRCLGDAVVDLPIDVREYQATHPDTDELRTPYLIDDRLDLSAWAHDSVVLALPDQIVCRDDCAGLCPECGKNLNDEPHVHESEGGDPRWSALERLKDSL